VSKSTWRRLSLALAVLVVPVLLVGCTDQSVNPPLAKTDVAPQSKAELEAKAKEPPKSRKEVPRGSAGIKRDPSGIKHD
jgi:hypothetical protein